MHTQTRTAKNALKSASPLLFLVAFLLSGGMSFGQSQNIGFSPAMDGGFESQPSSGAAGLLYTTPSSYYTVNNSNSVATFIGTGGRSGPKYISWLVSSNSANGFYTPSDVNGGVSSNTSYVVQFFYKFSAATGSKSFVVSISPDGINSFGSGVSSGTLSQTTWTKASVVVTSGSASVSQNATVKFNPNSTFSSPYYIDDIVVYPGNTVDVAAPGSVTTPTINPANNSLTLQWTAPAGGVEGGGYMVIRYVGDPTGLADPLQNGIYSTGATIAGGTIAYIGTSTSFVDNGLSTGTSYYYRIYSVDKAFNYSSPVVVTNSTSNNGAMTNLTVPNLTKLATDAGGRVLIGPIDPVKVADYKLAVYGDAMFTKVKVKNYSAWPDYVFEKDYPLFPLSDLEKYVKENKHLPSVSAANDLDKDGIDVGSTQTVLLQKIEELTLYIIDQYKTNQEQKQQITKMQQELDKLKKSHSKKK